MEASQVAQLILGLMPVLMVLAVLASVVSLGFSALKHKDEDAPDAEASFNIGYVFGPWEFWLNGRP